jgi:predicted transcriptional regulator
MNLDNDEEEISEKELRNAIIHALNYLTEEGMIVEENKKYRLKTLDEVDKEISDILND